MSAFDPLRTLYSHACICRMGPGRLKLLEIIGSVLVPLLALGALAGSRFGVPVWVTSALVGSGFVIALPIMWLSLRRRWWGR